MNKRIITYGLLEEQRTLLESALSGEYEISAIDCITDLIVMDAVCTVINVEKLSEAGMRTLLAYYMDVGDRLDETVAWLGNVDLPKLPSFIQFDNYLQLLLNCEQTIKQAQSRYNIMQQYTDMYSYLPKHAIAECLEADFYEALKQRLPNYSVKEAGRLWADILKLEKGAELLAAVYELCRWLQKKKIEYRMIFGYRWYLFVLVFMMAENNFFPTTKGEFVFLFCKEDFYAVKAWMENHWYFCNPDNRLVIRMVNGLETGITSLDLQFMGMRPGEVILVGGRPAMGKTSFAKGVGEHLTKQGKRVFHFDFICGGKEIHKDFSDFERELRASGADLAVFDHFQFLSDYDETDETAESLFQKIKALAEELQIPIMVLLHLNKNPETRPDPSPVTADIPHAEKILPFVDTVLLLYRRAYYDFLADRSSARCIIDKAKRCHDKVLSLRWDDENYRFTD